MINSDYRNATTLGIKKDMLDTVIDIVCSKGRKIVEHDNKSIRSYFPSTFVPCIICTNKFYDILTIDDPHYRLKLLDLIREIIDKTGQMFLISRKYKRRLDKEFILKDSTPITIKELEKLIPHREDVIYNIKACEPLGIEMPSI